MQTPFSYSYFGKDSEKIVFEIDNTPFIIDIESKNIKNQVVIAVSVQCLTPQYSHSIITL